MPAPSTPSHGTHPRARRVLVVHGMAASGAGPAEALVGAGYAVASVDSGASALVALKADFDLAVVDVELTDGSGVELCRRLVQDHHLPVILLASAASSGSRQRVEGLDAGAAAYLTEPVDGDVLLATARSVLRNGELGNRLELAVTVSGIGHWEWDLASGAVDWTESLERMHGFDAGGFPATIEAFVATIHPDDRQRVQAEMDAVIAGSGNRFEVAYEFIRTDGSSGHLIGRARVLRQGDGQPYLLTGVAVDVTERVESAARNTALVAYTGALMTTATLAEGRAIVLTEGAATARADAIDIEWAPAEDDLDRVAVEPVGLLTRPEFHRAIESGDGAYHEIADPDLDGAVAFRVVTSSGVGRLAIGWRRRPVLDDDERRFLQLLANHSISAIRQLADYERHRHIGLVLQRALLPQIEPVAGVEVATAYRPAGEAALAGGDWYDVAEIRPGLVVIAVGDVAGHGLAASVASAAVSHTMRAALATSDDLDEAMRTVDRILSTGPGQPCSTAAVVMVEVASGEASIMLAGHPRPLVRSADGSTRFLPAPHHPLLGFGLWGGETRRSHRFRLEPDDVIVLFTDGAFERRGQLVDQGLGELAELVTRTAELRSIVEAVADRADASTGSPNASIDDDTVVLAARLGR